MLTILEFMELNGLTFKEPKEAWRVFNLLPEELKPQTAVFERNHRRFVLWNCKEKQNEQRN